MKSYNSDKLVKLANGFASLAEDLLNDMEDYDDEVTIPRAPVINNEPAKFPRFKEVISDYLLGGTPISNDEWNTWLHTNASLLGNLPNTRWVIESESIAPNAVRTTLSDPNNDNNWFLVFLKLDPAFPKEINIKQQSMLLPVGPIPKLFLFIGDYYHESPSVSSKFLAQYDWIISSISDMVGGETDSNFKDRIEPWIIGHRKTLESIRKWFKYEPRLLGSGSDGTAWDIGDRKVLKIFSDQTAYHAGLKAVERLHKNPALGKTEAMIYDIGLIDNFENRPIFYWIMEKMVPVNSIQNKNEREELKFIIAQIVRSLYTDRSFWKNVKSMDLDKNGERVGAMVKAISKKIAKEINTNHSALVKSIENTYALRKMKIEQNNPEDHAVSLSPNWLASLAEEVFMKYLTGRTDLHLGNLGVTTYGEFRYFDPAFWAHQSDINLPEANLNPGGN